MKATISVWILAFLVKLCQCLQWRESIFFLTYNHTLINHKYEWNTVSSPVFCGRDCSSDRQCASFNYHISKKSCELNNATRDHSPADFIQLDGSAYYGIIRNQYTSCQMWYRAGHRDNGIYTIFPAGLTDGIRVYCDMETDGGGWIVFQRRQDGSVDFYRDWATYQSGFGDPSGEFWLGNAILQALTKSGQWELRVGLTDWENGTAWASYKEFAVSGDLYTLHVGSFDANSPAGDALMYHNGQNFTTKDRDNDVFEHLEESANCAVRTGGAWWFNGCASSHLNGIYYQQGEEPISHGLQWYLWKNDWYSMKKCYMSMKELV